MCHNPKIHNPERLSAGLARIGGICAAAQLAER